MRWCVALCSGLLATLLFFSHESKASELYNRHYSVRALGMGNAFIAVVDDSEALFYNPASLAKINSITIQPFRVQVGTNDYIWTDADNLADLTDDDTFTDALRDLYGESLWVGGAGYVAVTVPYFAAAAFNSFNATATLSNPALPSMDINYVNDYGFATGVALDLVPKILSIGFVGKYIQRTGTTDQVDLADITGDFTSLEDSLKKEGLGYSLDMGMNLSFPGPVSPTLSFVWRDIGNTSFDPEVAGEAPPTDDSEMVAGLSLELSVPGIQIRPAVEYRYLNTQDEPISVGKKVHVGLELDLPIISVRGGLNQGYWTAGFGLDLGLFRVDAASYGVELGEYAGQNEDRRYVIEFTMDLGFDLSKGKFLNLDKSTQRRLKQRR